MMPFLPIFEREPEGAEAAISWHLQEIIRLERDAGDADACDAGDVAVKYDERRKSHERRCKWLESQFPSTAQKCRDDLQNLVNKKHSEGITFFLNEPEKPAEAIYWHLTQINYFSGLSHRQDVVARHQKRLDQLENEHPNAGINARMKWRQILDKVYLGNVSE